MFNFLQHPDMPKELLQAHLQRIIMMQIRQKQEEQRRVSFNIKLALSAGTFFFFLQLFTFVTFILVILLFSQQKVIQQQKFDKLKT